MEYLSLHVLALFVLMCLSAFFSGSETALFALKRSDLHRFASSASRKERTLFKSMQNPERILITLLMGNLFVNIAFSVLSTRIFLEIWGKYGHLVSLAVVTPLLILLCEIAPKVIAINTYEGFSKRVIGVLMLFHRLFLPLRTALLAVTEGLISMFRLKIRDLDGITHEELEMAVDVGEMEGIIKREESVFMRNVLRFSKKEAYNVMIPRNKAVFIPHNATVKQAVKILLDGNLLRAPVFRGDLDNVVGMLDARELVPHVQGAKRGNTIRPLTHDIYHFPASRELGDLLHDFLARRIQIAIAVDEYGGTAGVVTLSSILSELMGRDFKRWENSERPEILRRLSDAVIISGEMQIHSFNETFDEELHSLESDTVAGYIIEMLGIFPRRNATLLLDKNTLRVRDVRKNRVITIEVIPNSPAGRGRG